MGSVTVQPTAPSRLSILHAALFSVAILTLFLSFFGRLSYAPLISGPCFLASGVLNLIGSRIAFAGALGRILADALGGNRITMIRLRAAFWILLGVAITTWGAVRLTRDVPPEEPSLPPPLAAKG
jgi:hypothetical protein